MTKQSKSKNNKLVFFLLWCSSIFGVWAVLPYVQNLGIVPSSIPFSTIFLLATTQAAFIFGIVCWISYLLLPKTDLSPFSYEHFLKRVVFPGLISGIAIGLIIYLLEVTIFKESLLSSTHPPFLIGFLASFYGAINEEILLRLFLFTFLYFLFKKAFRFKTKNRLYFLWIANAIVAISFGVGHLPAAFRLMTPSSFEIFRILLLNSLPGLAFGWLYWSRGLWTAMAAHFIADLMLHVILI